MILSHISDSERYESLHPLFKKVFDYIKSNDLLHASIGRIVLEGDTLFIDFETSDVYVNGEVIEEPYIAEPTRRTGSYINKQIAKGKFSRENPLVIGEDQVFVMGDNRNNSKDSREIGPVSVDDVTGHAVLRFWPLDKMGNTDYSFEE